MDFESNYGSSEYSPQAEELFAQYLLMAETGTAPPFEEYCATHEDSADELFGLHADWDNVRGLLAQLEGKRGSSRAQAPPPVEEPAPVSEPAPVEVTTESHVAPPPTPIADDLAEQARGAGLPWKWMAAAGVIGCGLLALWGYRLQNSSRVLAQEKEALAEEGVQARQQLELAQQTGEQLEQEGEELQRELETTRSAKNELQGRSEGLERDLESEREAKLELEQHQATLARELEQEKQQSLAATLTAERLACLVDVKDLVEREASFWPAKAADIDRMAAWILEAEPVGERLADLQSRLEATGAVLAPTLEASRLAQRIERTRARLERLDDWRRAIEGDRAELWNSARHRIADRKEFPAYDGFELEAQFALLPLGVDSKSGLWMFAELQTGVAPAFDDAQKLLLDESSAWVCYLVPGIELEGVRLEPFFASRTECSPLQRERALGTPAADFAPESEHASRLRYELDLARLGFKPMSQVERDLARQSGMEVANWKKLATRSARVGD